MMSATTRTRYPRHAATACEAITTTGNECRYLGKNTHEVITSDGRRLTVRLCGSHSKALIDTAPRWHRGPVPQTIRQNGETVDVWPAKTEGEAQS